MEEIKAGMLARSKAGHDKDQLYVIIKADPEYVYLVDGKYRPLQKPKKKNQKHIQVIKRVSGSLQEKIKNGAIIIDEEIKRELKEYVQARVK